MKGEIKNKYVEYVNHINFPVILYVYETNKIIAYNMYAREIIGSKCQDIREIFEGKKFRLSKEILQNGSRFISNVSIITLDEKIKKQIDMDINVLKVDNVHFILMLFDESSKRKFSSYININAMRVAWKYKNEKKIYMNETLKDDIGIKDDEIYNIEEYFEDSMLRIINEVRERIIDNGESQYNSIQMIVKRDKNSHFIKVNRMPIINSLGENIGILNVHNNILDKDGNRRLYDTVLQDVSYNKENEIINIINKKDKERKILLYERILENIDSDVIVFSKDDCVVRYINKKTKEDFEEIDIGSIINDILIKNQIEGVYKDISEIFNKLDSLDKESILVKDNKNNRNLNLKIDNIVHEELSDMVVFVLSELNDVCNELLVQTREYEEINFITWGNKIKI